MRALPCIKRFALPLVAVGCFMALQSPSLSAEPRFGDNSVYVLSNKNPVNSIIQFQRAENGSLTRMREVATGGRGTGPNGPDPLGSQDSLVLSGDGSFLLAVNSGSNDVSVFAVRHGRLFWMSKTRSGGDFPNSLALSDDLVYVLNSKGGTPNITGFRLGLNGTLSWIARVPLPPGSAGANDIRFAPDGSELLVTVAGTNQILVFPVGKDGVAGSPVAQVSAGGNPFGIRFGHNEVALVSEAAGSLSSYQPTGADMLSTISGAVADMQQASCWIAVPRDGKFAWVSNTASGTLSSFAVGDNGDVTLMNSVAADPGGTPIDSALSRDGKFLYVEDSVQGIVTIFGTDGGALMPVGMMPVSAGIQGIAAR
jgi:6-phosphogluconolactonase